MIGRVAFETGGRIIKPQQDYGIFLKAYDVTPPKAKIYRVQLAGADGSLDFSEWTGSILYETRVVTVELRDMHDRNRDIRNLLLGQRAGITFSDAPDWFYTGRCDEIQSSTRKHVTDMTLKFTCDPYRYAHTETVVSQNIANGSTGRVELKALKAPVQPRIKATGAADVLIGTNVYELTANVERSDIPLRVTDTAQTIEVVNNASGSITVSFTWRDGEL